MSFINFYKNIIALLKKMSIAEKLLLSFAPNKIYIVMDSWWKTVLKDSYFIPFYDFAVTSFLLDLILCHSMHAYFKFWDF